MPFLSDDERREIAHAIAVAEQRTSGELVAIIAHDTRHDLDTLLWPALLALLLPAVWLTVAPASAAWTLYLAQAGLFVVLALLLEWTGWQRVLLPPPLRRWRASRIARRQFIERGLHLTRERTGVLIFVAVAEHHVEIIADAGIDAVVPPGTWDEAVAAFVAEVRAGRVAAGFKAAIARVGGQLAAHFPRRADDIDELPNRLIEI